MSPRQQDHRLWAAATAAMLMAVLVCGVLVVGRYLPHRPQAFDSTRWIDGNVGERRSMARDLESRGMLLGRTRAELLGLLGPSDRRYFHPWREGGEEVWMYLFDSDDDARTTFDVIISAGSGRVVRAYVREYEP